MLFCFDESGSFSPPTGDDLHWAPVVAGVVISDHKQTEFKEKFLAFESSRAVEEKEQGEVKGKLLTTSSREEFCTLLEGHEGIAVVPTTMELSALSRRFIAEYPETMAKVIARQADNMVHETARKDVLLLSRQFENLDQSQALRLFATTHCLRVALEHATVLFSLPPHQASWNDVRFRLDRTHTKPKSREETVASTLFYAWLQRMSDRAPLPFIKGIHTAEHPLVKKYSRGDMVNLNALVKNNLAWVDSKSHWGVRVADIAANIVYQAVRNLDDRQGRATLFAHLMRSSLLQFDKGPGLMSISEASCGENVVGKYLVLIGKREEHGHKFENHPLLR